MSFSLSEGYGFADRSAWLHCIYTFIHLSTATAKYFVKKPKSQQTTNQAAGLCLLLFGVWRWFKSM